MATSIQQSQSQERRGFWQQLQELDFLSAFFSWFFMLLTRLSEPLMLLATLYVVAEAGVPAIAVAALHNLAIGVMITAPEVILPGCKFWNSMSGICTIMRAGSDVPFA